MVSADINGDGILGTLTGYNDWAHLSFRGLQDTDGKPFTSPWIVEPRAAATSRPAPPRCPAASLCWG